MVNQGFRGRDVFVTGHTGFKGSWLSLWLAHLGARVHGYSLPPPTAPNLFGAARVREVLSSHVEADVRDSDSLRRALRASNASIVVHMAAQSLVRRGYREPVGTFDVNVMGTVRLLEAVRLSAGLSPCAVIVVTSDKCYYQDPNDDRSHRESDPMGGCDPYSASKGAAELVVGAWRNSFFPPNGAVPVRLASARGGNVIGGGDWAEDRLVPDIVRALTKNEPVRVRNPRAIRPWQHVLDLLDGYLRLASRLVIGGYDNAWNFGPDESSSVQDLVDSFIQTWGSGAIFHENIRSLWESHALRLDASKARAQLGWQPRLSFKQAVERTARWYAAYYRDPLSARALCMQEIEARAV